MKNHAKNNKILKTLYGCNFDNICIKTITLKKPCLVMDKSKKDYFYIKIHVEGIYV